MVYHGLEFPREPFPGRMLLVFNDSSWHEELTADWIRKTIFRLHSEQMEIDCRHPMRKGHIDGIITDLLKVDRLWEHKAINHFTFQRFWGGELPLDNLSQCAVYSDGIQRKINLDCKEIILLIKNKNTAQYMEYRCKYDLETDTLTIIDKSHSDGSHEKVNHILLRVVESAVEKFNMVLDYISRKTLPKRPYEIDDWHCEYCGWGKTCWKGYEKEFNELKTDAMLPEEVETTIRYYRELGAQKKDIEDEYKTMSDKVKNIMKDAGAREGRAGSYLCRLRLVKVNRLDNDLIPEKIKNEAMRQTQYERLFISEVKEVA